jgi:hypothetical protein
MKIVLVYPNWLAMKTINSRRKGPPCMMHYVTYAQKKEYIIFHSFNLFTWSSKEKFTNMTHFICQPKNYFSHIESLKARNKKKQLPLCESSYIEE